MLIKEQYLIGYQRGLMGKISQYLSEYLSVASEFWQTNSAFLFQIGSIIIVTLILHFLFLHTLHKLSAKLSKTARLWDDIFFNTLRRPMLFLIWLIAFALILQKIDYSYSKDLSQYFLFSPPTIKDIALLISIGWFLIGFVRSLSNRILKVNGMAIDKSTIHTVRTLLIMAIIIVIALGLLQTIGISITGLLAFGGMGGLVLGFAAKDMLANLFGGLMVHLDCPFIVGEWIRSPDKNIEGTVEHIGWRQTRILTPEKIPLYVPNAIFANILVENLSRMHNRRIKEFIGIRYQDINVLPKLVESMRDYVSNHAGIDKSKPALVHFYNFGASSLDCLVHVFTIVTDRATYLKVREDILLHIIKLVQQYEAEIAFPTQTVHLAAAEEDQSFSSVMKLKK